jgi:hypothetical protein
VVRSHAKEALAHLMASPYPAAAYSGGISARRPGSIPPTRPRPCGQRREGSEGGRGVDPPNTVFIAPTCRTHGTVSPLQSCCKEVHLVERCDRDLYTDDIRLNLLKTRIPKRVRGIGQHPVGADRYSFGSRRLW